MPEETLNNYDVRYNASMTYVTSMQRRLLLCILYLCKTPLNALKV